MSAVLKPPRPGYRPMCPNDLDRVLVIERSAYEFPWSRAIFLDCLRVGYGCWIMELGGRTAGYGVMSLGAGESHILNLCIAPDLQRRGLGRDMLHHLLDISRERRADTAFLEVRPSNLAARNLYAQAGFDDVGVRRNYYPARSGREDAIIMALALL